MISVVIPAYKNKEEFIRNIKHNFQFFHDCEVIVINDDPSESISDNLKEFSSLVLLENTKNLGFGKTVNRGIEQAKGEYILLLNTDVVLLDSSFLKAVEEFKKDASLFAVSFAQKEKDGSIVGKNRFYWQRGFFYHEKASDLSFGPNGWAEGGSCMIDKSKFNKLNGFDPLYSPFYWEDTDLSYRAWKMGYKVVFNPEILVEHHHSATIGKYIQNDFKNTISARNHFIFIWKNIQDSTLLLDHVLFLPYNLIYFIYKKNGFFLKGFLLALLKLPTILSEKRKLKTKKSDKEVLAMK